MGQDLSVRVSVHVGASRTGCVTNFMNVNARDLEGLAVELVQGTDGENQERASRAPPAGDISRMATVPGIFEQLSELE